MAEEITKIKVGNDVRCILLDTEVIDTSTIGFGGNGKLGVRLGSSVYADEGSNGIGVKIHPDTQNYLQREHYGLSLKLDTMVEDMTPKMVKALGTAINFVIDLYKNTLKIDTGLSGQPLFLGTGLKGVDDGHTLCLSLGSGLMFDPYENTICVKIDEGQQLLMLMPDGTQTFNLDKLYSLLEARYNLTKK